MPTVQTHLSPLPQASYFNDLVIPVNGTVYVSDPFGNVSTATGSTLISSTNPVSMCFLNQTVFFASGVSTIGVMSTSTLACSTLKASTTPGGQVVPTYCTLADTWRGRLVLAGASTQPQNFFMSRLGQPTDWNYAATDGAAAVAGNLSESGQIGEPITAVIPFNDDLLIFSTVLGLWLMEGDPADGGTIVRLTQHGGLVGKDAWCIDPTGTLFYITQSGLWSVIPIWSVYRPPQLISGQAWSQFFETLDINTNAVSMAYDAVNKYIRIYVTPSPYGFAGTHLVYDVRNGGFWPATYPANEGPTYTCSYITGGATGGAPIEMVAMGGLDGNVHVETNLAADDEGNAIQSYITLAPINPNPYGNAILNRVEVDLGELPLTYPYLSSTATGGSEFDFTGSTSTYSTSFAPNSTGALIGAVNSTNRNFTTVYPINSTNFIISYFVFTTGQLSLENSGHGPTFNGGNSITLQYPVIHTVAPGFSTAGYFILYNGPGSTYNLAAWNANLSIVAGPTAADVGNDGYSWPTQDSTANSTANNTWATTFIQDRRQPILRPRLGNAWFGLTLGNSTDGATWSMERVLLNFQAQGLNRGQK
ncbi:MAG: hypothetical protein ABSB42_07920 [Tepidisphaeraceae bacterium]|jgi:hypothetical protein